MRTEYTFRNGNTLKIEYDSQLRIDEDVAFRTLTNEQGEKERVIAIDLATGKTTNSHINENSKVKPSLAKLNKLRVAQGLKKLTKKQWETNLNENNEPSSPYLQYLDRASSKGLRELYLYNIHWAYNTYQEALDKVDKMTDEEIKQDFLKQYEKIYKDIPKLSPKDLPATYLEFREKYYKDSEMAKARIPFTNYEKGGIQYVARCLSMNNKPRIVSKEEFAKLSKTKEVYYRGVKGTRENIQFTNEAIKLSGEDVTNVTMNGNATVLGRGIYGTGIYFTSNETTAKDYTISPFETESTPPMKMIIDESKVKECNWQEMWKELGSPSQDVVEEWTMNNGFDFSYEAMKRGYNAIRIDDANDDGDTYYCVLDRSIMIMEER